MSPTAVYLASDGTDDPPNEIEDNNTDKANTDAHTRFGAFEGQYVQEGLMECLTEPEAAFKTANADPTFWAEINSYASYTNRPSSLHLASRLTEHAGGARIWLKREDLNHTGSHKSTTPLAKSSSPAA